MNLKVHIEFYDNTRYTYWVTLDAFTGFRCTREKRFPEVDCVGGWTSVLHPYQMRELEKHSVENIYGVDVLSVDNPEKCETLIYARFYKEDDPNREG